MRIAFTPEQDQQIAESYLAGESTLQLAKRHGVWHTTIHAALERTGTPRRPAGARGGNLAPKWSGGRIPGANGYMLAWKDPDEFPEMNGARCYVLEHRLVMARHLGRALRKNERVHHKNGERADNRIENLELWIGGHPAGQRDAHCPTCTCFNH